jgi:hypothetical protein
MNIGLFAGPTFRPHAEHVAWLGRLAEAAGHRVVGLSCDGAVCDCYARSLLGRGRLGCIGCSVAGLRSDPGLRVTSCRSVRTGTQAQAGWSASEVLSSVRTLLREEDDSRLSEPEAVALQDRLARSAARMYGIVHAWIEDERLDALLVFNGRMDITRAAIRAARHRGIAFVTVERSSFDTGLRIVPMADCNSLREDDRVQAMLRDTPLMRDQALLSAEFIARRVMRMPVSEWRSYNPDRRHVDWPGAAAGTRVLVGPSSQYEVRGEEGWEELGDMREAVDAVIARLGSPASVVVRAHPVWGERIAGRPGHAVAAHYRDWCSRRGYHFVEAESDADTRSLVLQADLVLATGGTIGIEAACAGRAVLTLAPCYYRRSGAVGDAVVGGSIDAALAVRDLEPRERMRYALRAIYSHAYRTTQYCHRARPVAGTSGASWEYRADADFAPVEAALRSGELTLGDARVAEGCDEEDGVIDLMQAEEWEQVVDRAMEVHQRMTHGEWGRPPLALPAQALLAVRGWLPKGDRLRA